MAWNLDTAERSMRLVQDRTVADVARRTGYKPAESIVALVDAALSPTEQLKRLGDAEQYEGAIQFLAFALHRRAGVWWSLQCVQKTREEIQTQAAKARQADKGAGGADPVPRPAPPGSRSPDDRPEAAEASSSRPSPQPVGPMVGLRAQLRRQMGSEGAARLDASRARMDARLRQRTGKGLRQLVFEALAQRSGTKPASERPPPPSPPAAAGPGKGDAAPAAPSGPKAAAPSGSLPPPPGAHEQAALARARAWVEDPTEANGRAAYRAGEKTNESPAGFVAKSAFWSSTNIAPEGQSPVPPPPGLGPQGVFVGILLSSKAEGGTTPPPLRQQEYLALGLAVARGENTWEQPSPESPGAADPWAGKAGFGRPAEGSP